MMPPPLPKLRPPRQSDAAPQELTARLDPSQMDDSYDGSVQPTDLYSDLRSQQPRLIQQRPGRDEQQALANERPRRLAQQTDVRELQESTYGREQQFPPPLSARQVYGRTDLQLPGETLGLRRPLSTLNQSHHTEPLQENERLARTTRHNQPPSRDPLPLVRPRAQDQVPLPSHSQPAFQASGGWRGVTPKDPTGSEHESRSSQWQFTQPRQLQRRLEVPSYQQPGRTTTGHNGTTTLSSEFKAQERATDSQRHAGLLSQTAKRRGVQQAPLAHVPSDISYYDPVYGTLEQQSGEDAPREIEGFYMPPPPSAPRAPLHGAGGHRLSTPANRKHLEPPAASSVASPFFGQPFQRQPAEHRQDRREQFSYARPSSPNRGVELDHHQRSDGMPPPPNMYPRLDRSLPPRDPPFLQPGGSLIRNRNDPSPLVIYDRGSQRVPLAINSRSPQPAASRGRVSLPTVPQSSQRSFGRAEGALRAGPVDTRSIFSGAGPTRRSIRR